MHLERGIVFFIRLFLFYPVYTKLNIYTQAKLLACNFKVSAKAKLSFYKTLLVCADIIQLFYNFFSRNVLKSFQLKRAGYKNCPVFLYQNLKQNYFFSTDMNIISRYLQHTMMPHDAKQD